MRKEAECLLRELNKLRSSPSSLIPYLEEYRSHFNQDGLLFSRDQRFVALETVEGAESVEEAIRDLACAQSLRELQLDDGLTGFAQELSEKLTEQASSTQNTLGPEAGPVLREQLEARRGLAYPEPVVCLVSPSFHSSAAGKEHLTALLLDDGAKPVRANRAALFNPRDEFAGCGYSVVEGGKLSFAVILFTSAVAAHSYAV